MKIAPKVAIAVILTDKAMLALAIEDIKFDILPPGQADTNIIPNATAGVGSIISIKIKVIKGSRKN